MKTLLLSFFFLSLTSGLFASQDKKQLKLRIQAANGNLDQVTVYFDLGIISTYSYPEDAQKVFSSIAGVPAIYAFSSDSVGCSLLGYSDLTETAIVDLGVVADSSSLFSITLLALNNFDGTTIITLEDRQLNKFTDMRTNFYQVKVNVGDSARGRFFLHVTKAVLLNTTTAGCANNDGMIAVTADSSMIWDLCQLYDSSNNMVAGYSNINGQFSFTNLPEGAYHVNFTHDGYTTTQDITVNGTYVKADIGASLNNAIIGEDINFSSSTINATQFEWDFGDGTLVTGVANPTIQYYVAGNFTVNLKCSNDAGCSQNAHLAMAISVTTGINDPDNKGISILTQRNIVTLNMNDVAYNGAEIQLINLLGQPVYSASISNQTTVFSFNELPSGIYVVAINNAGKVTAQKVYINN